MNSDAQAVTFERKLAIIGGDVNGLRLEIDRARVLLQDYDNHIRELKEVQMDLDRARVSLKACEVRARKWVTRAKEAEKREAALLSSWSWRLSAPVRAVGRVARHFGRGH